MDFTFSKADAQLVIGFLASVAVPFVVSALKRASWAPIVSLIVALLMSLAGGLLTEYAAGTLDGGSIIAAGLAVFVASQAHFATWFQSLGLEQALNPDRLPDATVGRHGTGI